jgi:uncharacterized glyoxalase superfamily protein PhnB
MFTGLTPMLICADVQASIKFYTDVIGLEVDERMDDVGKSGWASVGRDGVHLMLASPTYFPDMPKVNDRYYQAQYYFYTDELDALREHIKAKGAETTEIIEQSYGMREFEMVDPDGHILIFGQNIAGR